MWKPIHPGQNVTQGDTIRYQPSSSVLSSVKDLTYEVVKVEQHYFEVVEKNDAGRTGEVPRRKVIKYLDIGYHIRLEAWSEPAA